VAVVLSLLSALAWGSAAVARGAVAPEPESQFVGRIADERGAASLGALTVAPDLVDVARRHAQEMADQQRLFHNPSLGSDVQSWQKVGENVGVGSSVEEIHQAFMASSSHRDNILDHDFTEVGVGVIADGPDLWVVEVFRLPKAAAAEQPAPAPAPSSGSTSEPSGDRASGSGGGSVRAANAGTPPPPTPTSAAPAPSTTSAPPPTVAPTTVPAPSAPASVEPAVAPASSPVTSFDRSELVRPSGPSAPEPTPTTAGRRVEGATARTAPRDVSLPIGIAAGMLVLVVGGLAWQVASDRVRVVSGRRVASVVDVWELALAA
jgi:hypothetical protein